MGCVQSTPVFNINDIPNNSTLLKHMNTEKSVFYIDNSHKLWKIHKEHCVRDSNGAFNNNMAIFNIPPHRHLLIPESVLRRDDNTSIISMAMADTDLFDILSKPFDWDYISDQLYGIASAIKHLHSHGRAHRDIKPENIVSYNGHLCLIDFDFAYPLEMPVHCGTENFKCSREVTSNWNCSNCDLSRKMDVYAFGKLIFAIFWQAAAHSMIEKRRFIFEAFHCQYMKTVAHPFTGNWCLWASIAVRCIARVPPSRIPIYLATGPSARGTKNSSTYETGLQMALADESFA